MKSYSLFFCESILLIYHQNGLKAVFWKNIGTDNLVFDIGKF